MKAIRLVVQSILYISLSYFLYLNASNGQKSDLFQFKHYTTSDGLSHNVGFEILQTSDGYIWVGTDYGMSRFDGFSFRNFGEENGLQNPFVVALDEAVDGTVHLGTYGGGHHFMEGDTIIKLENESPSSSIQLDVLRNGTIVIDGGKIGDSELYMKTVEDAKFVKLHFFQEGDSIGYFYSESNEFEKYKHFNLEQKNGKKNIVSNSRKERMQIYAYCVTREDQLWLSTNWGVFQFPFGELKDSAYLINDDKVKKKISVNYIFSNEARLSEQIFYSVAEDPLGNLWFGGEGILAKRTKDEGKIQFYNKNLPQQYISRFAVSPTGRIFFATSNSILAAQKADLYCYDLNSGNLNHLNPLLNLQSALSFLYIDREDNLWVSTHGGGLYCLFPQKITNYTIEDGLTNSFVQNFVETPDGSIWASTQSGINIYRENAWKPYSWFQTQDFASCGLSVNKNGDVAISGIEDSQFFTLSHDSPPSEVRLENFSEFWEEEKDFLPEQRLVIQRVDITSKNKRINNILIKNDVLKELLNEVPEITSFANPVCFAFSNDTIWMGIRSYGLFKIFDDKIVRYTKANGLPSIWINDLEMEQDGTLWIGTKEGISHFDKGLFRSITVADGLLSNWCQTLHFDHRGVLWIGTPRGLHYLQDGQIHAINSRQGLVTDEVNDVFEDSYKRLWIGTTQGISVFDNSRPQTKDLPPEIFLEKVELNGQRASKAELLNVSSSAQLGIFFSSIAFQNPLDISFQYRFNTDNQWITTKNRSIILQNLEEGRYSFEVRAKKLNSDWGASKKISWEVHPPWWATKRFGLLGGLSLGLLIAIIPFFVVRSKQRKKIEEAQMQNKLSRLELKALQAQMNPHFIFNAMNAIMHFILNENKLQANLYLSKFAKLMRLFLDASKSNYIVLDNELEMLQLYIDLEMLRFKNRFDFKLEVDSSIKLESIEIPSMILQPIIENAINHGLANKKGKGSLLLKLEKNESNDRLTLIVEDNGVGREAAARIRKESLKQYKSHASNIIESRIQILNATFSEHIQVKTIDLTDDNGNAEGTRVELIILLLP